MRDLENRVGELKNNNQLFFQFGFVIIGVLMMSFSTHVPEKFEKISDQNYKESHSASSNKNLWGHKKGKKSKKDAFAKKSKKRPNIYSSNPPLTKSKSKLYQHSVAKKKTKKTQKGVFSSSKNRYNLIDEKAVKKAGKASNNGRQVEK